MLSVIQKKDVTYSQDLKELAREMMKVLLPDDDRGGELQNTSIN